MPTTHPGVQHFRRTTRGTGGFTEVWYDRFPGGCVTSWLRSSTDVHGVFATEVPVVLGFTTRQALRQTLDDRSNGRLRLDPA